MQTETHPVEASKVQEHLKRLLDEVPVKTAVAIGVKNFFKGDRIFENPRWYVTTGKMFTEPPTKLRTNMGGAAVFQKTEYSMRGTSGLLSYDISGTDLMICVFWMMPLSETLFDNRYLVSILRQRELNDELYSECNQRSRKPDEEIDIDEHEIYCKAMMTRDAKAMILVECRSNKDVSEQAERVEEKPKQSHPVGTGQPLMDRLREWLRETDLKSVCAIGINNFTTGKLTSPCIYLETGQCLYELPVETETKMGAPALFGKKQYSLRGCAGVFTYNIEDRENKFKIAVMWSIPMLETVSNNVFNVHVIPLSVPCDRTLYTKMKDSAHPAKDGDMHVTDEGYKIQARMEPEGRATLVIDLNHRGR